MTWTAWRDRFDARAQRSRPMIDDITEIPPPWRTPLATSLARFQLGETGEGRIVADLRRRATAWNLHPDYLHALQRFIAEEGRHARILGDAVRALGGQPLRRSWSATAFARIRRLAGPGLELRVLLAAEIAALTFYDAIARQLPVGPLRTALAQIADDERLHLRFHVALLRERGSTATRRRATALACAGLGLAASTVLLADHGHTLLCLGISPRTVLARTHAVVGDTFTAIARPTDTGTDDRTPTTQSTAAA